MVNLKRPLIEDDALHERVWSNLPWLVNETLTGEELSEAKTHVAECLPCRREMKSLQALQQAVATRTLEPRCEAALSRLHERIDDGNTKQTTFPWAAAAVLVIVTSLTAYVGINSGLTGGSEGSAYRTLGTRTIAVSDDQRLKARIVFDQDLTERQLRELLLKVDAELIDGPTPRGAYTIAMPNVRGDSSLQRTLAALRASDRVMFVEPVVSDFSRF